MLCKICGFFLSSRWCFIIILYSKLYNSAAMQGSLQFLAKHLTQFVLTIKMNVKVLNKMSDLGAIYGRRKLRSVLSSSGFF